MEAGSYDGSWMTLGHTSHMGLGCVIDVMTGLVIDHHMMSTFCHTCATTGAWMKDQQPARFDAWMEEHRRQGCDINFEGSSEVEAAKVLWRRSIQRYSLGYIDILRDGDVKTHKALCDLQPYEAKVRIEKEECINHMGETYRYCSAQRCLYRFKE
ncbi:hypothetical protein PoB_004130200 [Plakobranchus ocellatus]|uniref:Mutator-like transposase domain-containing protein n=1 Tax=Plakobranchus ocellatus TaxID=259542 RepID=A0AAV4B5L9_9GAST|nr:hypothetical protein PoB_004130200 [Plakobranchus ocellatus]